SARLLADRSARAAAQRHREWLDASQALRRRPGLLVYYTFEGAQDWGPLPDQAGDRQAPHAGAVVGCSWGPGRWPGKQALEFRQVSDRVRLRVPEELDSVTLLAWARVDGLPNVNNSLLMADGWPVGGLHWQIGSTGTLILGVQSRPKGRGAHYHAEEAITPDLFGRWLHLAVVYDRAAGQVTHYVNGEPVARAAFEFDVPLRIGDAEVGNWNIASHRNNSPVRYFSGGIDELMVFSRALPDEEVKELYAQGRPAP